MTLKPSSGLGLKGTSLPLRWGALWNTPSISYPGPITKHLIVFQLICISHPHTQLEASSLWQWLRPSGKGLLPWCLPGSGTHTSINTSVLNNDRHSCTRKGNEFSVSCRVLAEGGYPANRSFVKDVSLGIMQIMPHCNCRFTELTSSFDCEQLENRNRVLFVFEILHNKYILNIWKVYKKFISWERNRKFIEQECWILE